MATWFKQPWATRWPRTRCSAELETDKVSVEVPAPAAGTLIEKRRVRAGRDRGPRARCWRDRAGAGRGRRGAAPAAAASGRRAVGAKGSCMRPRLKKAMAEAGLTPAEVEGTGATAGS